VSEPRDISAEKAALRSRIRAERAALDLSVCLEAAEKLAVNLLVLPEVLDARTVLSYQAMPEEIDPGPALERLRLLGVTIVFPRIEGPGILGLHVVEPDTVLLSGPFGLAEPPADAPTVEPSAVDVVLMPGVAFDSAGRRLGHGGGYFDRLIPQLRGDCCLLGVAFDVQVVDEVPTEPHDARVDAVVTPTRVLRVSR
jgi:5-formyltetrahydrofolate cyclo-ligase